MPYKLNIEKIQEMHSFVEKSQLIELKRGKIYLSYRLSLTKK